jgi:hypothetical protein
MPFRGWMTQLLLDLAMPRLTPIEDLGSDGPLDF